MRHDRESAGLCCQRGVSVLKQTTPTVENPCIRCCCLDLDDVCLGCGRTYEEIVAWHRYTLAERERHLCLARQRLTLKPSRKI
ncbi:MAG: DUF1289 domain-containing protein [Hahellaceae bacterium]|nr:DUF1289 domain-containing protein [Hahellaceae bacterium]